LSAQEGAGTFPTFVSVSLIDLSATIILLIILVGLLWKYFQWKKGSPPKFFTKVNDLAGTKAIFGVFFKELANRVLLQRDVIHKDSVRRATHLMMFWGFIGLSLTTTLDYILNRPGNYIPFAGGSLSPIRCLGNVSGAVMMIGATIAIIRLIVLPKFRSQRTFGDVWFSALLFLSGLTGFITEYLGDKAYAANPNVPPAADFSISLSASLLITIPYGIHLVSVGLLLITAPFSAFIHALNVPSLRYVSRLANIVSLKTKLANVDEYRKFKETAMEDELQQRHEEENK
jgi:hypothetical protein